METFVKLWPSMIPEKRVERRIGLLLRVRRLNTFLTFSFPVDEDEDKEKKNKHL
jgi:hypothetical protein